MNKETFEKASKLQREIHEAEYVKDKLLKLVDVSETKSFTYHHSN